MDTAEEFDSEKDTKRLFFGAQVTAAWPQELPNGKIITEEVRHITLAVMGQNAFHLLEKLLAQTPQPSFRIGMGGIGTDLLYLPKKHPRVVALHINWLEDPHPLFSFQMALCNWLESHGFGVKKHSFLPHITMARTPFEKEQWEKHFEPVPFYLKAIHLYESLGNLNYSSLWSYPLTPPFKELDHTADIAFIICAISIRQLFVHAQLALFFKFPPLAQFYTSSSTETLNEIIIELNRIIALADEENGCPLKAVSFHGSIVECEGHLTWEMIVDV